MRVFSFRLPLKAEALILKGFYPCQGSGSKTQKQNLKGNIELLARLEHKNSHAKETLRIIFTFSIGFPVQIWSWMINDIGKSRLIIDI